MPIPDARQIAAAGRRRLVRRAVLEAVMAVVWVAVAVMLIRLRPDPALMVLGAGIITFVAVASGFSIWNAAGVWQPAGDSVRDFVIIAIERRRRDLRAARFGLWFAAVETLLIVAWLVWTSGRDVLPEISRLSNVWAGTARGRAVRCRRVAADPRAPGAPRPRAARSGRRQCDEA